MAFDIRRVEYFNATVRNEPGEAFELLGRLADAGINLLAFSAVPTGGEQAQLALFPEDSARMTTTADRAGIDLDGPHSALLVQGDDELGALAGVHARLFGAGVNVVASTGVADGKGSFGYVVYVRPEEFTQAARTLGV